MATRLSFSLIPDFPLPAGNFQKTFRRVPLFVLPSLGLSSENHFPKSFSSCQGGSPAIRAVNQEMVQSPTSESTHESNSDPVASSKLVLVVGASGGVGQLVAASLIERNVKLRLLLRDPEKARTLFGEHDEDMLQVYKGDTRNQEDLDPSMFEGVTHVICCTGTTAFPSKRWDGDNTPERVDWEGVRNLISALPQSVKRIVLVSSIGVTKFNELPWS